MVDELHKLEFSVMLWVCLFVTCSGEAAASWHLVLAGAMISAIPMTIVYLIFSKYFVKGVAAGAVKG